MKPAPAVQVRFRGALPREVGASAAFDAATELGRAVEAHFGMPCVIVVNANRQRVLWWRQRGQRVEMSVHWALLPHADDVLGWLRKEPLAIGRLRALLPDPEPPPAASSGGPRGEIHDLGPMLAAERARWPDCPDELYVEWGSWPTRAPRRTLRLGSCLPPRIRIHPVLDHATVPAWFVGFIVFHEVLHVRFPPQPSAGARRNVHTRGFRALERAHPDFERAHAFEQAQIGAWLARCRARVAARRSR